MTPLKKYHVQNNQQSDSSYKKEVKKKSATGGDLQP